MLPKILLEDVQGSIQMLLRFPSVVPGGVSFLFDSKNSFTIPDTGAVVFKATVFTVTSLFLICGFLRLVDFFPLGFRTIFALRIGVFTRIKTRLYA